MFTDIVGSSALWKQNEKKMKQSIINYEEVLREIIEDYGGIIVKTIGDAFMVLFKGTNGYIDAIKCAMDIQISLDQHKIKVTPKKWIKLRIGLCQGEMEEQDVKFQDCDLKDYYGQTVNIASRMESKVAGTTDIALAFNCKHEKYGIFQTIADITRENDSTWEVTVKKYDNTCTPSHNLECFPEDKLHGVGKVRAYLMKLKSY